MRELIDRQEAIDAIYDNEFSNWCDKDEVSTILNDLPSVDDVITYEDCANVLLLMWMENILTDGEYNRILGKLNKAHDEGIVT